MEEIYQEITEVSISGKFISVVDGVGTTRLFFHAPDEERYVPFTLGLDKEYEFGTTEEALVTRVRALVGFIAAITWGNEAANSERGRVHIEIRLKGWCE